MTKIFYFIKRNWFLLGIFIAVLIGYYFPSAVTRINRNGYLITLLVIAVFFIQGLTIEKEKLLNGLKNIKLHIFIFFFTFIFYPLYFYIAVKLFPFLNHNEAIVAGMFALACLPTTILVSSVFVNNAGGNTSITVLNVVLSNIIGVFIAPIILSLLLNRSTLALPLSMVLGILKSLVIRIIIPMGLGMAIRKFAVKIIDKNRKKISMIGSFAILVVVCTAFAGSSDSITIELIKSLYPVFIFLGLTYLFISFVVYKAAGLLNFGIENVIAAVFTTTQKTLSMGVTIITLYFVNNLEIIGVILIPLLFYHPWQIFMSSFIVNFLKKRNLKA